MLKNWNFKRYKVTIESVVTFELSTRKNQEAKRIARDFVKNAETLAHPYRVTIFGSNNGQFWQILETTENQYLNKDESNIKNAYITYLKVFLKN